jgi:hypothetical protein
MKHFLQSVSRPEITQNFRLELASSHAVKAARRIFTAIR